MNGLHEGSPAEERQGVTPEDLSAFDLNLIVAFDALARERSVTAAAVRVGVTQSAMSHALRRLRDVLGDPLLVRGRGGMVLTPRAEALVVPLRSGLVTLGRALTQPAGFEPGTARRAFCLATPDLFDVLAIPLLLERIRKEAPGVTITIVPSNPGRLPEQLETGEIDAAVVPQVEESLPEHSERSAPGLVRRLLFRDRHLCLLRADHPVLRAGPAAQEPADKRRRSNLSTRSDERRPAVPASRLSLETYAALSHMVVSPLGAGPGLVDQVLAKHGLSRRVALRIPHFYSALSIIASCDLILTAPTALARLAPAETVATFEPPLRLPGHSVNLIWHERFTKDPGHEWLRNLVTETGQTVQGPRLR